MLPSIQLKLSSLSLSFMVTPQSGFCSVACCLLNYKSAWTFHHCEIFEYAHLKFTVSGRSKPTSIHTRVRNAVTLVWGSLRLSPTTPRLEMVHTLVPTALTQPNTTTYYIVEENITSLSVCVSCMSDPPIALIRCNV